MKPGTPPNVFGRAAPRASDEGRVVDAGLPVPDPFDDDVAASVVAEVMDVEEPLDRAIGARLDRFETSALALVHLGDIASRSPERVGLGWRVIGGVDPRHDGAGVRRLAHEALRRNRLPLCA